MIILLLYGDDKESNRKIVLCFFLSCCGYRYHGISNQSKNKKLNIRKGLPNFFNRIKKGDSIRIAYFGGSITQADKVFFYCH